MEVHDVCFFNINKPDPSDIVASRAIDKPDYICHFGILGMKWGVRRYQNDDGTLTEEGKRRYSKKIGGTDKISLYQRKTLFGSSDDASKNYEILDNKGEKVGDALIDTDKQNEYHIDWLGVNERHRRKGYGNDALDILIKDAKKNKKYKKITLDAAGLDPAALHLYKKKGFKIVKTIDDDGVWNGLTVMQKDIRR